jgi:hypothetical protein
MRAHSRVRPTILLVAVGAAALGAPALAQTNSVFRNVEAVSGKVARLGSHTVVKPDCSPGPLPEIKVLTPPKNGSLNVRTGKAKTTRYPKCPNLETPAIGVFYMPPANFKGSDEIIYELKAPDGRTQSHHVRITVTDKPAPAAKPQDGTDL